jgi:1,2-diacylglycerol 3-alpha-glucosyltransferase
MRIAFFTNSYYPVISGVVRSVSSFRQALSDLGHDVFVFAPGSPDTHDQEPYIFRYPSLDLGLPGDVPATIPIWPFVDRLLPPLKLDVIHSHHPVLLGNVAASKAEELNLPLVFTFHSQYREYSRYVPLTQELVQEFVKEVIDTWLVDYISRCQHIVVPSESIRQLLARDYGVTSRVTVIPTGLDLAKYQQADGDAIRQARGWGNDRVLISAGRLAREKNWETLLAAFPEVIRQHPEVRLVIVGEGEEHASLEASARKLGIRQQVEFTGSVLFDEIPAYLKAADLFCFASVTETQGLVTLEAMAAGLPVVAVDASGTSDVVTDGHTGLLTDNDSRALTRAILKALEDPSLLARLRQGAQKRAREFSIQEQARKLLEVYQLAAEARKENRHVIAESRQASAVSRESSAQSPRSDQLA